ncbi:MAG TPA: DUF1810 domain-containing protein [Plantibacter sp.]|uniref:DUF1810 domain-containing protein n=1 Tax=Plantibacter sp. TaxID=1871045 RepID=UPI002D1123EB|nr:DUF1810 domain-containing protein [Plantibacter sp.]
MTSDPYDLERFTIAQDAGGAYASAVAELRGGRKIGHWMWFVFPQIAGLGTSLTSRRYAISSLEEAVAYLEHPVLGKRLDECTRVLAELDGKTAHEIFGSVDAMKLRSSLIALCSRGSGETALPCGARPLLRRSGGRGDDCTPRVLTDSSDRHRGRLRSCDSNCSRTSSR